MGFHFANEDPPFGTDLENPGVLVYYANDSYDPAPGDFHEEANDGDLILGAVEWLVGATSRAIHRTYSTTNRATGTSE